MSHNSWEVGYHLRSPRAWLNDPNGCCQFRGRYYFYYQYNPFWPTGDTKQWGLFTSEDLAHWRFEGVPIEPTLYEDKDGAYSGCALVEPGAASDGGDLLRVFYTGNVVCPGPDLDPKDCWRALRGREANEITVESEDGIHFGEKRILLRTEDYPWECTRHVRDPKVWRQDGQYHMLLGAWHINHRGMCLLYDSDDGYDWRFRQFVEGEFPFGFMWECPNIVQFESGHEYLAFSPMGLPRQHDRWHNRCQAGYVPLPGRIIDTTTIDERTFVEWDHGHDFYAPQTFQDDSGRWIVVGWLGVFDPRISSTPDGLPWCHCLTIPRELTRDEETGLLLQTPVAELETLREGCVELESDGVTSVPSRNVDIVLSDIEGAGALTLDDSFEIWYKDGRFGVRYLVAAHACGRTDRSIPLDGLSDLRVLVDGSVVEVYCNGGREVFSCRWFPEERADLAVRSTFSRADGCVWVMGRGVDYSGISE